MPLLGLLGGDSGVEGVFEYCCGAENVENNVRSIGLQLDAVLLLLVAYWQGAVVWQGCVCVAVKTGTLAKVVCG